MGGTELLRQWRGDATHELRRLVVYATADRASLIAFVLTTITVLLVMLAFTSAVSSWPISDFGCDQSDGPCR